MVMFRLVFSLALLWPTSAFAAGPQQSAPESGPIILVASGGSSLPVGAILRLEPDHLLALGAGLVVGAAAVGPYLGIGEAMGVAAGVITGELAYRSGLWPFQKTRGWLE